MFLFFSETVHFLASVKNIQPCLHLYMMESWMRKKVLLVLGTLAVTSVSKCIEYNVTQSTKSSDIDIFYILLMSVKIKVIHFNLFKRPKVA